MSLFVSGGGNSDSYNRRLILMISLNAWLFSCPMPGLQIAGAVGGRSSEVS